MLMFTFAIPCLTTSNLPWFVDLTFQVPMQYCSIQHQTLFPSSVRSHRMVLWRHTRPSKSNTQKRCPFHYSGLECKSRKSRDTWSNREVWPWSTIWSRTKASRVLPRERTDHSKHPLPAIQENTLYMDIAKWSIPKSDWLYSLQPKMEKLYTVSKSKPGSWLWLKSWILYCKI